MSAYNQVFHCSADRLLRLKLPAASAHAVLLDPPSQFGIGESEDADDTQVDEQVAAFEPLATQVVRALLPGGSSLMIGAPRATAAWEVAAERAGLRLISELIVLWDTAESADSSSLRSTFSSIRWHVRPGNRFTYRSTRVGAVSNAIVCKPVPIYARTNPAQLPVELYNYLVTLFTYRGDLVVDPFCGSGSSLVAAANTERRWVGCDIDEEQMVGASRRVASADTERDIGEHHPLHLWSAGQLVEI